MGNFDAILVPGGGVHANGQLPLWSINRLDRAVELADGASIVTLSAGTTHKAPPLDEAGRPIVESVAAARYLEGRGYPHDRILAETASYDTIGNAYFARVIHTDPAGFRNLLVITSAFHMARTEGVFRWIFAATPVVSAYELSFDAVPDIGLSPDALEARYAKERASLASTLAVIPSHPTLPSIHRWLFAEHAAYAIGLTPDTAGGSPSLLLSY
jgi:DUF218 domain